jgi:asparagine synthase (glutamine-hydrolysing)
MEIAGTSIKHRGPDSTGHWISEDNKVAMVHNRLAIIDPVNGSQPFVSSLGSVLVFNGEIYNYLQIKKTLNDIGIKVDSFSDTEILSIAINTWGTKVFDQLDGQFSFVYLATDNSIIFGRDRAGEKPLYFYKKSESICFASELKAICILNPDELAIDPDGLNSFLTKGQLDSQSTILSNMQKLPPGHYGTYDTNSGDLAIFEYWSVNNFRYSNGSIKYLDAVDELDRLINDAVKKQLVSDVPIGLLLSGGLDSSLIAALSARINPDIKAFTAIFPEEELLNEAKYAKSVSNYLNLNQVEVPIFQPSLDELVNLGSNFDEPILDPSIIPTYLLSKEISRYCKVVLGGDGADELFGGYPHYLRSIKLSKLHNTLPNQLRSFGNFLAQSKLIDGKRREFILKQMLSPAYNLNPLGNRMFSNRVADSLFPSTVKAITNDMRHSRFNSNGLDVIDILTRHDFNNYLPSDILVKVDRASMLASIEMRSPYLDHKIIEFSFKNIPSSFKIHENKSKRILKDVAKRYLQPEFEYTRKLGFVPPTTLWASRPDWNDFMKFYLLSDKQDLLNKHVINDLFEESMNNKQTLDRLLVLTLFEIWRIKALNL